MSTLRQRFRVIIDDGEPLEVTTNARDLAAAQDYRDEPVLGAYALVYAALERQGVTVPPFEEFIDTLDEFQSIEPSSNGAATVDPTSEEGGESAR